MNKSRHFVKTKTPEKVEPEKGGNETVSKPRSSARSSKQSKVLEKAAAPDHFQIRKPLNIYMIEELKKLGRKTYFQRVYVLAKNIDKEKLNEYSRGSNLSFSIARQLDFREYFQRHVDEIFATCEKKKCTQDNFSGLFIAMGTTHSCLMIEGAEDMLANFFEEFDLIHDRIWNSSRVFLVEDKIGETYFNCFYSRRSAAININETFPPSTPDDYHLMAVQHLNIKGKLKSLIETLSLQMKNASALTDTSKDIAADPYDLAAETFNKLLPEIQRIDLVLNCNRFYRTVKDFTKTYRVLQTHEDEDALAWPIPNNYMPLDIFKRSEFDVNLTFGHYGEEENKEKQKNKVAQENDAQTNASH